MAALRTATQVPGIRGDFWQVIVGRMCGVCEASVLILSAVVL